MTTFTISVAFSLKPGTGCSSTSEALEALRKEVGEARKNLLTTGGGNACA
jgi:hypothetical protein